MPRRFFSSQNIDGDEVLLEGPEAHHLLHVLRLGPGDDVLLLDGSGLEALARVDKVTRTAAALRVLERRASRTETPAPITLGTAVPKGDRFGWLIEKATELGVRRVVPLLTQRTIVDPGAGKLDKMRQTVIAASKQCGRSQLLQIDAPVSWKQFLDREAPAGQLLIAHPAGGSLDAILGTAITSPVTIACGPEGGFTDAELELACSAGAQLVGLGPRILRIETAALALVSLLVARMGE